MDDVGRAASSDGVYYIGIHRLVNKVYGNRYLWLEGQDGMPRQPIRAAISCLARRAFFSERELTSAYG